MRFMNGLPTTKPYVFEKTFNSLYEILTLMSHNRCSRLGALSILFMRFLRRINAPVKGRNPLSILFMRFHDALHSAPRASPRPFNSLYEIQRELFDRCVAFLENFQFSLWDSEKDSHGKYKRVRLSAFNSLYEIPTFSFICEKKESSFNSLYEIRCWLIQEASITGTTYFLSILFMRFSASKSHSVITKPHSLSILFMRFSGRGPSLRSIAFSFNSLYEIRRPDGGRNAVGYTPTFNSLYEILQRLQLHHIPDCYFQFSLWDSPTLLSLPLPFSWAFNSLYEIPDIDKRLIHRLKKSLSILFMRFLVGLPPRNRVKALSILFMRFID